MALTPLWPGDVDTDALRLLGPSGFDGFVNEKGQTDDLYYAYVTLGWRRIMLGPGAQITADLTIAANNVVVWSPFHRGSLSLTGAKKITVSGFDVMLAGFMLDGSGAAIEVTGRAHFERVAVRNGSGHGIYLNTTENEIEFHNCESRGNTNDGLRIASGASSVKVIGGLYYNNGGYGINDLDDSSILAACRVAANTTGQINGTPALNHAVTS